MASANAAVQMAGGDSTEEILTDKQIQVLLQEAEDRLRTKAGQVVSLALNDLSVQKNIIPRLQHNLDSLGYIRQHNGIAKADPDQVIPQEQKKMATELRPVLGGDSKKANDITHSGPEWFNIPKTDLTPQLKRDLQLIEMRNVLDPHRHYKKNTRKGKIPVFSQVGTVVEGPTEFYSSRINKKDRSKNFVEEAMKTELENGRFKRKYNDIQEAKTSGRKAHYKKLMTKRKKP